METKRICGCDMTAAHEATFWKGVDRDSADPCWIWNGGATSDNYGVFRIGTKVRYAHRIAYELVKGAIPAGLEIRHGPCASGNKSRRLCVNPDHLAVGTRDQNIADTLQGWWRPDVPDEDVPLTDQERADMVLWEAEAKAIMDELSTTPEEKGG